MFDIAEVYRAKSIDDAINALTTKPDPHVICGGTDVLVRLREGKWQGCTLVSIHDIPGLKGISVDAEDNIHIAPATSFIEVMEHPLVQERIPVLAQAASTVGGPQIRAMGTVGGNICNGATSADTASTLLALDAQLTIAGPSGNRLLPLSQFYKGPGKVALEPDELLIMITIRPEAYRGFGGCYLKYSLRRAMDIATLGTVVLVKPDAQGKTIAELRLGFGVAAPTPIRCLDAEQALIGKSLTEAEQMIGELVKAEINPRTSWRASKEFRLQVAAENSKRALRAAFISAGGEA